MLINKEIKKTLSYLLFAAIVIITVCIKNNIPASNSIPSPDAPGNSLSSSDMLTSGPWKSISFGFDQNKNGLVEDSEEGIMDCESDNTYIFNKDGSGLVLENIKLFDGRGHSCQFRGTLTSTGFLRRKGKNSKAPGKQFMY